VTTPIELYKRLPATPGAAASSSPTRSSSRAGGRWEVRWRTRSLPRLLPLLALRTSGSLAPTPRPRQAVPPGTGSTSRAGTASRRPPDLRRTWWSGRGRLRRGLRAPDGPHLHLAADHAVCRSPARVPVARSIPTDGLRQTDEIQARCSDVRPVDSRPCLALGPVPGRELGRKDVSVGACTAGPCGRPPGGNGQINNSTAGEFYVIHVKFVDSSGNGVAMAWRRSPESSAHCTATWRAVGTQSARGH